MLSKTQKRQLQAAADILREIAHVNGHAKQLAIDVANYAIVEQVCGGDGNQPVAVKKEAVAADDGPGDAG